MFKQKIKYGPVTTPIPSFLYSLVSHYHDYTPDELVTGRSPHVCLVGVGSLLTLTLTARGWEGQTLGVRRLLRSGQASWALTPLQGNKNGPICIVHCIVISNNGQSLTPLNFIIVIINIDHRFDKKTMTA